MNFFNLIHGSCNLNICNENKIYFFGVNCYSELEIGESLDEIENTIHV